MVTISIVSHNSGKLINILLGDLAECAGIGQVIIIQNVPEDDFVIPSALKNKTLVVKNAKPVGFGANHNKAFRFAKYPSFFIVNPDIRVSQSNLFVELSTLLGRDASAVAPLVLSPDLTCSVTARKFLNLRRLFGRLFLRKRQDYEILNGGEPVLVDWVCGMLIGFDARAFSEVKGFDEKYFMYCEDMDICYRLKANGFKVLFVPDQFCIHESNHQSHRDLFLFVSHLRSICLFFSKTYLESNRS